MGGGGYVSKATHEAQVEALRQEADALRQQVAGSAEEVQIAKVLRERLLNAVDDAVLGAVGAEDVAERFGTATGAVEELRTELKELRSVLATKDAEAAALRAAREAAAARAAHERLAAHKLKTKLAEVRTPVGYVFHAASLCWFTMFTCSQRQIMKY